MDKYKLETVKHAKDAKKAFLTALKTPFKLQSDVAQKFLNINQHSQFGRTHGFEKISQVNEYQKAVPIRTPDEYAEWMERAAAGEKNVLTAADPVVFFTSSGSTGKNKQIPVTAPFVTDCYLPFVFTAFGNFFDYYPESIFSNESTINFKWDHSAGFGTTHSGKPHIGASQVDWAKTFGATAAAEPGTSEIWSNPPEALKQHLDRLYYRVRLSIGYKIQTLIGINPALIATLPYLINQWSDRLISDISAGTVFGEKTLAPQPQLAANLNQLRHYFGRLLPVHLWPELKVIFCWTSGIAQLYLPQVLRDYGSSVELMPAPVAASEGPIGVPIDHHPTAGAVALPWVLLEFIDADQQIQSGSPTLMFDSLKLQGEYHVVLSHIGGLYRYALGDIIRVVGKYNDQVPLIQYAGRNHHQASDINIPSESAVIHALSQATQRCGVHCINCSYRVARRNDSLQYQFALEIAGRCNENDKRKISEELDQVLMNKHPTYRVNRETGKLDMAAVTIVPNHTFSRDWCNRVDAGVRPAQVKDRIYETNQERWESLMNASDYNPVSKTALLTAAVRAIESKRPDGLYVDQFAEQLAGAEGFRILQAYKNNDAAASLNVGDFNAIRTRYFDDTTQHLVNNKNITQIVLLGAGLDTRAFRITWPEQTTVYELDNKNILDHKNTVLKDQTPTCNNRHTVAADLRQDWYLALQDAGYNRDIPSIWVLEGLMYYLSENNAQTLLRDIKSVCSEGSFLLLDLVNNETLNNQLTKPFLDYLRQLGAPYLFATDSPEAFFNDSGIRNVTIKEPGESDTHYGRWPTEPQPKHVAGIPRAYFAIAEL